MTNFEKIEQIKRTISMQSVESLKDMATKLFNDTRDGTDLVFELVVNRLMSVMPEQQFVDFMDSI